jgi:hypothetical protein
MEFFFSEATVEETYYFSRMKEPTKGVVFLKETILFFQVKESASDPANVFSNIKRRRVMKYLF